MCSICDPESLVTGGRQWIPWSCNYRGLWATGCVQETDLGSSTKVANTLNCRIIFLASITVLLKENIWKHFVVKPQWFRKPEKKAQSFWETFVSFSLCDLIAPCSSLSFVDDNIYSSSVKGWTSLLNCELSLKDSRKFHSVM